MPEISELIARLANLKQKTKTEFILDVCGEFGFSHFGILTEVKSRQKLQDAITFTNWPVKIGQSFRNCSGDKVSGLRKAVSESNVPFAWDCNARTPMEDMAKVALNDSNINGTIVPVTMSHGAINAAVFTGPSRSLSLEELKRLQVATFVFFERYWSDITYTFTVSHNRRYNGLSPLERKCLRHLVQFKSPEEVGELLDMSPAQVDRHVAHVADKLYVTNPTHALVAAIERPGLAAFLAEEIDVVS